MLSSSGTLARAFTWSTRFRTALRPYYRHTGSLWNSGWTSRSPSSPTSEFPQTSSRTLQSGTVNLLKVHRAKLHSRGDGAAPRLWNPLPEHLRSTTEDLRPLPLLLVSSPRYVHRSFHAFFAALSDVFNVKCNINHIHYYLTDHAKFTQPPHIADVGRCCTQWYEAGTMRV